MATLPVVRIEAGFSGPGIAADVWHVGDPVRGKVGTFKIGSADIWTDITPWVRNWSFRRGASSADGVGVRYEAGTFTAELNNGDRRFDPTWLAGPYTVAGETLLKPMVRVRLTAEWAGVAYRQWYGYADHWVPDYDQPTWSTTTLTARDGFKILNQNRRAVGGQGAGEDTGARIRRIADSVNWDADLRSIAVGKSSVQATTLDGSALAEAQLTQDAELGELYIDRNGMLVFRNRHAAWQDARSNTSQGVFGDAGIASGEIPYISAPVDTNDETMANRVSITRVGGTEQVVQDLTSQSQYLLKDYERSDLPLLTDAEALDYAKFVLSQGKQPELRFQRIGFNVPELAAASTAWPMLLARELGDSITVRRRPPGGGPVNQRDMWIRGIEMTSDGQDWKVAWQLQQAIRASYWTVGHPTLGRIGSNAVAF